MTVHELANRALARGVFSRKPCEICDATKAQMHHDNYLHPFTVRWLCAKHHGQWHKNFKAKNTDAYKCGIWVPLSTQEYDALRERSKLEDRDYYRTMQRALHLYLEREVETL